MNLFKKLNFFGSFLSLFLLASGCLLTLDSCIKDADEPNMTVTDDKNDPEEEDNNKTEEPDEPEDPATGDDEGEGEEGENHGDTDIDTKPTNDDLVPADFTYPLAYMHLPDNLDSQFKDYTGFTVSFNKSNHTPNYVAWELLAWETYGDVDRNNYDFKVDYSVEGCPTKDYAYSTTGYQRGHMCPAADQKWSEQAMIDCMYMTNICPQYASLNEKIWSTLENNTRQWARRDGALWVVAGPVYSDDDQKRIGASEVRVPGAYFKALLFNDEKNPRAIAFVFTNGSNPGNLEDYAMSIDDLEEILGYDLFPALPDDVEEKIEATYNFSDWTK